MQDSVNTYAEKWLVYWGFRGNWTSCICICQARSPIWRLPVPPTQPRGLICQRRAPAAPFPGSHCSWHQALPSAPGGEGKARGDFRTSTLKKYMSVSVL